MTTATADISTRSESIEAEEAASELEKSRRHILEKADSFDGHVRARIAGHPDREYGLTERDSDHQESQRLRGKVVEIESEIRGLRTTASNYQIASILEDFSAAIDQTIRSRQAALKPCKAAAILADRFIEELRKIAMPEKTYSAARNTLARLRADLHSRGYAKPLGEPPLFPVESSVIIEHIRSALGSPAGYVPLDIDSMESMQADEWDNEDL